MLRNTIREIEQVSELNPRQRFTAMFHDDANRHPFGVPYPPFLRRPFSLRLGRKTQRQLADGTIRADQIKCIEHFILLASCRAGLDGPIPSISDSAAYPGGDSRGDSIFPGRIQCPGLSHIQMVGRRISFYKC